MNIIFSNIIIAIFFLTVIFLHNTKKVSNISFLYGVQSLAIVSSLVIFYFEKQEKTLLLIAIVNLIIKVIIAPIFFIILAKRYKLNFSDGTFLNTPITLLIIAGLTGITYLETFKPLINIIPENQNILSLSFSFILISIFLIINSKGELLQIAGILSLENGIVMFGIFSGLEQSFGLQMGIMFDIFVWIIISIILTGMIYKHIGSLNTNNISHLTD